MNLESESKNGYIIVTIIPESLQSPSRLGHQDSSLASSNAFRNERRPRQLVSKTTQSGCTSDMK